jgi:hypothetical protein
VAAHGEAAEATRRLAESEQRLNRALAGWQGGGGAEKEEEGEGGIAPSPMKVDKVVSRVSQPTAPDFNL